MLYLPVWSPCQPITLQMAELAIENEVSANPETVALFILWLASEWYTDKALKEGI